MPNNHSETTLVPEMSIDTKRETSQKKDSTTNALKSDMSQSRPYDSDGKPSADHPIHQIPLEKQEKWRKKGIDPVLRAEMEQSGKGEGGFWRKVAQTSMGGGFVS